MTHPVARRATGAALAALLTVPAIAPTRAMPAPAGQAGLSFPWSYDAYPQRRRITPNGGYHVNRYGYGNYTEGSDGGYGGYPAGSAGAQILREQERRKCEAVPESC